MKKHNNFFDQLRLVDDKRLAKKSVTMRLPVHVLARIEAMCDLMKGKTRTDIIIELLKVGIDTFEDSLPEVQTDYDETGPREQSGPKIDYQQFANHHWRQLELELGNKYPKNHFFIA